MKQSLKLLVPLLLSGCTTIGAPGSTLDRNLNLKYSNEFGDQYCPTSGAVLVGTGVGVATGIITSASLATGVGIIAGGTLWLMAQNYEQTCKSPEPT